MDTLNVLVQQRIRGLRWPKRCLPQWTQASSAEVGAANTGCKVEQIGVGEGAARELEWEGPVRGCRLRQGNQRLCLAEALYFLADVCLAGSALRGSPRLVRHASLTG